MESSLWAHTSEEAKDLINHLIVTDPEKRFSAEEALKHPWFSKELEIVKKKFLIQNSLSEGVVKKIIKNKTKLVKNKEGSLETSELFSDETGDDRRKSDWSQMLRNLTSKRRMSFQLSPESIETSPSESIKRRKTFAN